MSEKATEINKTVREILKKRQQEQSRDYYANNREVRKAYQRSYQRANGYEAQRKYQEKNRERQRLEYDMQCAVVDWAKWNANRHPELELLYHTPNGEKRDKATAARLKRMGVLAGVPDLHLSVSRGAYSSLYIELKAEDGKLSPEQAEVIQRLRDENNDVKVCRSTREAIEVIEEYLRGARWSQQNLLDWVAAKHCPRSE